LREIALHLLDVAENGVAAGASRIRIRVVESRPENRLELTVEDDGAGIPAEMLRQVTDPFVTSRTTRRVGLGLSLLKAAAERCEGRFDIRSAPGEGTRVAASFRYDHIDRAPSGDIPGTMVLLMAGNPGIDFEYVHEIDGETFVLDTAEIRETLGDIPLSDPAVTQQIRELSREAVAKLRTGPASGG
jgi:anti-sigma regulatory factor (Ser/Thr protein kinase)